MQRKDKQTNKKSETIRKMKLYFHKSPSCCFHNSNKTIKKAKKIFNSIVQPPHI